MWHDVRTKAEAESFLQGLRLVHPAYLNTTAEGLARIRAHSGVLSVYDAPSYQIYFAMSLAPNPKRSAKEARVWTGLPYGIFTRSDLPEIAKAVIRKIRLFCDSQGVRFFRARALGDYEDPLLNEYIQKIIPSLMHEVEETDDPALASGAGRFRLIFDRRPEKKTEDDLFLGRDKFRNLEGKQWQTPT